jgi:hypothetical protein
MVIRSDMLSPHRVRREPLPATPSPCWRGGRRSPFGACGYTWGTRSAPRSARVSQEA